MYDNISYRNTTNWNYMVITIPGYENAKYRIKPATSQVTEHLLIEYSFKWFVKEVNC